MSLLTCLTAVKIPVCQRYPQNDTHFFLRHPYTIRIDIRSVAFNNPAIIMIFSMYVTYAQPPFFEPPSEPLILSNLMPHTLSLSQKAILTSRNPRDYFKQVKCICIVAFNGPLSTWWSLLWLQAHDTEAMEVLRMLFSDGMSFDGQFIGFTSASLGGSVSKENMENPVVCSPFFSLCKA